MLGRNCTQGELDDAKAMVDQQLASYKSLANAVSSATTDEKVDSALEVFEVLFFSNMALVLDRYFVHRLRVATGKDGNPLNELEMLCDSLMNNNGALCNSKVIKLISDESVVKLEIGDSIKLTEKDFDRLSAAFFAEIERKFL